MLNSLKLLNTCINTIDAGIGIIDRQGTLRMANVALAKICETSVEEIEGKHYQTLLKNHQESGSQLEALILGEQNEISECKFWHQDQNRYKYIRGYAKNEVDDELGSCRIIFINDISEEVAQRENLKVRASILKNVRDSIIVVDNDGIIIYWNAAATELFGIAKEKILGAHINEFNPGFDPKAFIAAAGDNKDYFRRIDWKFIRADGTEVWADVKLSFLFDESEGDVQGFIGVSKDITEKKQQELELVRRNKEFASLIDSQTNFLARIDTRGNFTYVNQWFQEKFDYGKEIVGHNFMSEIHPDDVKPCWQMLEACKASPGKAIPIELRGLRGKETFYWEVVALTNEEGEVTEYQGVGYDITESKLADSEIRSLKAFNELLLEISTELINATPENLDERIHESLQKVTTFANFDRAVIYLFTSNQEEVYLTHEYCAEGIAPFPDSAHRYSIAEYGWWSDKIFNKEAVEVQDIEQLPTEAASVKQALEQLGALSMLMLPVAHNDQLIGALGFTSYTETKDWDKDTLALFKLLGAMLGNTFKGVETMGKLKESITQYALLADNVTDIVLKHDLDFKINFITPSCKDMLGYEESEVLGQSFASLVYPEDLYTISTHVQDALSGKRIRFITRLKKKDGNYIWIEARARATKTNGATELIAIIRDIDLQKQIEVEKDELFRETHALNEELRASEEELLQTLDKTVELNEQLTNNERKFKGLIEKSFEGIVVYGMDARVLYASPSATQIMGYSYEEVINMTGRDFIYPEDLPLSDAYMSKLVKKPGERISFEIRCVRKDREVIWIESNVTNLLEDPAIEGLVVNFRDITERKKYEIRLEEIRTSLNLAQKVAKIGSWEVNLKTMESFTSEEFHAILGLERNHKTVEFDELVQFLHPEDRQKVLDDMELAMRSGAVNDSNYHELEYRIIDKKGDIKHIKADRQIIIDEEAGTARMIGTIQDVTREKELKRLLDETSKVAKVGGWEVNLVRNELVWTEETYRIHELPLTNTVNLEEAVKYYHPEDLPMLRAAVNQMINQGQKYDLELRLITAKGKLRWVRATAGIVNKVNGKIVKFRGSIQDITERKKRDEEIQRYSERLKIATKAAQIGVWEVDVQNDMLKWDAQTCEIFGLPSDNHQGKFSQLSKLFHPDDMMSAPSIEKVRRIAEPELKGDFRIIRPDNGEVRFIKSAGKVFYDEHKEPVRIVGVHWDITPAKQNEERLERKNAELIKINSELDHFVYSTSHNLRAPLTSVMGIVNIMREVETAEEREVFIDMIQKSIYKLDETIQEINDYSKNARVKVEKEHIDFRLIIDNILESLSYMENAQKMKMQVEVDDDLEYCSDPGRLKIIFNNLLSNAVKYANPIEAKPFMLVEVKKDNGQVFIRVKDNGIGIKEEYLERVFNMFFRATNKSSGSGLGLYIVKEAVEKLGGNIEVESVAGEGTEFIVRLPL
ncbi:PAS domain S-box protein [Porifericola rhodea]|uniref:PAS domain S-box protein n=1 Tax=Porifericola rhodea TaxID=930972 RepID=UPI002665AED9|nr:PAS domain S-box protein [Porifericola rhodea]WKN33540.1 PAS domain S-box protein [Porifericola rhodea]